jgi:hypothetical protein
MDRLEFGQYVPASDKKAENINRFAHPLCRSSFFDRSRLMEVWMRKGRNERIDSVQKLLKTSFELDVLLFFPVFLCSRNLWEQFGANSLSFE